MVATSTRNCLRLLLLNLEQHRFTVWVWGVEHRLGNFSAESFTNHIPVVHGSGNVGLLNAAQVVDLDRRREEFR